MREYKEIYHSLIYKNNSDLALYSAGYEDCAPGKGVGPRIRPYNMIHFVSIGNGTLEINRHTFELKAGDVFFIPADQISYYEASKKNPWFYSWLNFLGIQSQNYMHQFMSVSPDSYVLHLYDVDIYYKIIRTIVNLKGTPTYEYMMGNSLLWRVFSQLATDAISPGNSWNLPSPADDLRFYLDMHYAENFLLRDVIDDMGYHHVYLARLFKERYGISPKKYLSDLKLRKACNLLATTKLPINLISASLGFEDQLVFSRKFHNTYGMSPSEYRTRNFVNKLGG